MQVLPPAEDTEEALMDRQLVYLTVPLQPAVYRRLLTAQYQCRLRGKRLSLQRIINLLMEQHLPPDPC